MQNNYLDNNEHIKHGGDQQSGKSLMENTNTWVSFLTENVSISRVTKPLYDPELSNTDDQEVLEQALKVIQELGGGVTKKEFSQSREYAFSTHGEIRFNFIETRVKTEIKVTPEAEEEKKLEEEKTELKTMNLFKEIKEVIITSTKKVFITIFSIFKDLFGGLLSVYKQSTERVLTEEEKRKKEEEKQKEASKNANKKAFYQALSDGLSKIRTEFLEWVTQNKSRLKIEGLSLEESNRLLGKTRNVSFRDIDNTYDHENIAVEKQAMEAKRREEERQKALNLAIGKKKTQRGPNVEMNMEKAGSSDNQVTKLVG